MKHGTSITASAPGSLMLLGEHAVLHGRLALVAAVSQRLAVSLTPRPDTRIEIVSALGRHETDLRQLEPHPQFRFILKAIERDAAALEAGFTLSVVADFSHTIGFGSSAAVTVAAVGALRALLGRPADPGAVFARALEVVRDVQGLGSGADVAASVHGGIVAYRARPLEIQPLTERHPLTAVYSGSKRPTPEVVRLVNERGAQFPHLFEDLFDLMERCSMDAFEAIQLRDWTSLGRILDIGQGLMDALGVNNAALSSIIHALRADPGILGAKISGSGLGDCAIGLGRPTGSSFPHATIPVDIAEQGLLVV